MVMRTTTAAAVLGVLAAWSAHSAGELETTFLAPPESARPLTWWHWLDGNVTREGITGDLEAMSQPDRGA